MSRPPSREQLLHLLAEAAELEHNLLCSYLFALFSLKTGADEDLQPNELAAVQRWREALLAVCVEEMTHLAQVANLSVALGFQPHLDRPNLPVAPGYHPAAVVVELTRFDADTLDHLIFLERPEGMALDDGASFVPAVPYVRSGLPDGLMPGGPEYETIGEFYDVLRDGLVAYAEAHGEAMLFVATEEVQLSAKEVGGGALRVVRTLADACAAIDDIVRQGEGSRHDSEASHFARFCAIRSELEALQAARPGFDPARPVGRNPVMRTPTAPGRTHVTAGHASRVLDAANALYAFMLRCLMQCYATPRTPAAPREAIVSATFTTMKAFAILAGELTRLPATDHDTGVNAGVSFAMLRAVEGGAPGVPAAPWLQERLDEIRSAVPELALGEAPTRRLSDTLADIAAHLASMQPQRP